MRSTFNILFYVNKSKEKGGTTRLSVSGRMTACGIEKSISYHCRRHSFATLALLKGMPIESVSRVLGHTNIVTTQIYAKNTSQKLNADLTMLGDKLNASFKSIK